MTMITPSAQLTLTKGNKSWSSTAVAAANSPGLEVSVAVTRSLGGSMAEDQSASSFGERWLVDQAHA